MIPKINKKYIKLKLQTIINSFGYQINSVYHTDPFKVTESLIKKTDPVIFDIGAFGGRITKTYRKYFPDAKIYSFEPSDDAFKRLFKNFSNDPKIFCYNKALAENTGTSVLNINVGPCTNSILSIDDKAASFWGKNWMTTKCQNVVETVTIDEFCNEMSITEIDILKVDVQGSELSVLKGASGMLSKNNIKLIYLEILMCPTYKNQPKYHEIFSFLDSYNYQLLNMYNLARNENQLVQLDSIFLSTR